MRAVLYALSLPSILRRPSVTLQRHTERWLSSAKRSIISRIFASSRDSIATIGICAATSPSSCLMSFIGQSGLD